MDTLSLAGTTRRLTTVAARRLFLDRGAEFWLRALDPAFSLRERRARVVEVVRETADTRTFVLRRPRGWRGHRAGQHVLLDVEIEGVRVRRGYTLSSAPGAPNLSITVKHVPGGRVSGWLHRHAGPGTVVGISAAAGDFVLPDPVPARLLFLGGGSGITPLMAMLRHLAAEDAVPDLVFVHHARSRRDVPFAAELARLAARHPGLRLVLADGPLDETTLADRVPDFAARDTYLCGPAGLMSRVEAMWAAAGAGARLQRERFGLPPAPLVSGAAARVTLEASGRAVTAAAGETLLAALERGGERPVHGCRMGICGTCTTRKRRGTVRDLRSGALSGDGEDDIRLCTAVACSDVAVAL